MTVTIHRQAPIYLLTKQVLERKKGISFCLSFTMDYSRT